MPVHKKNDKQLVKNYRPLSLLKIFEKSFEKIIFNKIYHLLLEEKPIWLSSTDSSIDQFYAITHEIFEVLL